MDLRLRLLNDWQHGFPLLAQPFDAIADAVAAPRTQVLAHYADARAEGALSRIGGVFAHGAGGAGVLAAMQVPPGRLDAVAAIVSAHPGVNHNYAREHGYNLWFVLTGADRAQLERGLRALEARTGLAALRLWLLRPYRIDLGFDLRGPVAARPMRAAPAPEAPLPAADWPLAALAEEGLPLLPRPFALWGERLGLAEDAVLARLASWLQSGRLKRFGVVVRHHELGYDCNAMAVFDVPDEVVDACGLALAAQSGVTLAYRRTRDARWPYNLYAMVHGTRRDAVQAVVARAAQAAGLAGRPQALLFSTRRYKQTGARRFRALAASVPEAHDAVAG